MPHARAPLQCARGTPPCPLCARCAAPLPTTERGTDHPFTPLRAPPYAQSGALPGARGLPTAASCEYVRALCPSATRALPQMPRFLPCERSSVGCPPHPDGQSGARGLPTAASANTCAPRRQRVCSTHHALPACSDRSRDLVREYKLCIRLRGASRILYVLFVVASWLLPWCF